MKCSCKSSDLLNFGCNCGAFSFETSNHVWFNGIIYAVARNEEEAVTLCREFLETYQDFEPEWLTGDGWKPIPDENELPLLITEETDEEEVRLAFEWAEYYGPGFLASI